MNQESAEKLIENYNHFENVIRKITNKNQNKWRNMNYKKYDKMRDIVKYQYHIEWVLQEYINNPLLIKGKKFHFVQLYDTCHHQKISAN